MTETPAHRIATSLRRRGLVVPARLLADAHRPISPLLDDLGAAVGPLLGTTGAVTVGRLLEEPGALERLITELDATEDGGESG